MASGKMNEKGALKIESQEDKIGVQRNETIYPVEVWCANKVDPKAALSWFDLIQYDNAMEHDMFLIVSDGLDQLIETRAD